MMCHESAYAHEMTPTYPEWRPSHVRGVAKTTMEMFNKRQDVKYYEIGVFDKEWKPVKFVSQYKILNLKYLGHVKFDIYVNMDDIPSATYICSKSKVKDDSSAAALLSSKVCSKIR